MTDEEEAVLDVLRGQAYGAVVITVAPGSGRYCNILYINTWHATAINNQILQYFICKYVSCNGYKQADIAIFYI